MYKAAASVGKGKNQPAASRKRDAANGFMRTVEPSGEEPHGSSKAARLLLLLGIEDAAAVMASLSVEEAEVVARQIAATRRVDTVEARSLLAEFGERFSHLEIRRVRGGVEAARDILSKAFGAEQAEFIFNKAVPGAAPRPLAFLDDLTFAQLASLLRKETPTSLALIMSCIDPSQASRLLESLPQDQRAQIVLRMARTQEISNSVLATVEAALQERLRLVGKDDSEELDGRSALADILRYMDIADERRLLDSLEEADPKLATEVKEKLYTMDTIFHLRKRDLQTVLMDMDEKEIAMLLKGQPPEITEYITSSLSSRRHLMVRDEGDLLGPIPRSEVDHTVRKFLDKLKEGEQSGTYVIVREEEDLI